MIVNNFRTKFILECRLVFIWGGDSSHCNLFPVGTSFGVVTDWGSGLGVNDFIRNKEGSRCQYKAGNGKYIHATQEHDLPSWWPFKVTCVFIRTNVCHQCSWIYIHVCTLWCIICIQQQYPDGMSPQWHKDIVLA